MTDSCRLTDNATRVALQRIERERASALTRLRRRQAIGLVVAAATFIGSCSAGLSLLSAFVLFALIPVGRALSKRARAAIEDECSSALLRNTHIGGLLNDDLRASLLALEEERRAALARRRWALRTVIAIGLLLIGAAAVAGGDGVGEILLVVFFCWLGVRRSADAAFEQTFKEQLGRALLQHIDAGLTLTPRNGIMEQEFVESRLFQQSPDWYVTEDLVAGKLGQTEVRFADVDASVDAGDGTATLFRGVFFVADFHKHFAQSVILKTDHAEAMFGGLGRAMQRGSLGGMQRVELEDPEFERLFVVYADDETEARYLLTPDMMRRFVELSRCVGRFSASFQDGRLYLAIPRARSLFAIDMGRSVLELTAVREAIEDVYLFRGLVEALDLNTRIWTKE